MRARPTTPRVFVALCVCVWLAVHPPRLAAADYVDRMVKWGWGRDRYGNGDWGTTRSRRRILLPPPMPFRPPSTDWWLDPRSANWLPAKPLSSTGPAEGSHGTVNREVMGGGSEEQWPFAPRARVRPQSQPPSGVDPRLPPALEIENTAPASTNWALPVPPQPLREPPAKPAAPTATPTATPTTVTIAVTTRPVPPPPSPPSPLATAQSQSAAAGVSAAGVGASAEAAADSEGQRSRSGRSDSVQRRRDSSDGYLRRQVSWSWNSPTDTQPGGFTYDAW